MRLRVASAVDMMSLATGEWDTHLLPLVIREALEVIRYLRSVTLNTGTKEQR